MGAQRKVRTETLIGPALDWAVAIALGEKPLVGSFGPLLGKAVAAPCNKFGRRFQPSEFWAQGGPIIEKERVELLISAPGWPFEWRAYCRNPAIFYGKGPAPLIAAMRCFVASRLGNEVDIPEELQ